MIGITEDLGPSWRHMQEQQQETAINPNIGLVPPRAEELGHSALEFVHKLPPPTARLVRGTLWPGTISVDEL